MSVRFLAKNFRGFSDLDIRADGVSFLVGDNSSGKSSVLHLIDAICRSGLVRIPAMNEELGVSEFDFFSPYFDYADVTIGYRIEDSEQLNTKLVTLGRRVGKSPVVKRVSYFSSSVRLTLLAKGTSFFIKGSEGDFSETDKCYDSHFESVGYKKMTDTGFATLILEPGSAVWASREKTGLNFPSIMDAIQGVVPSVGFIGPIRSLPERYYEFSRKFSATGLHFASMFHEMNKTKVKMGLQIANKFGRESGLFDRVNVEEISKSIENAPLLVTVLKNQKRFMLNQVGVGVSQVVPVLAEALHATGASDERLSLIQQPELHLHPVAQSALGSFFYRLATDGFSGILETHSSFLLDRFRSDMRDAERRNPSATENLNCRVYFFESGRDGNSVVEIGVNKKGQLENAPDKYHRFFIEESIRTM